MSITANANAFFDESKFGSRQGFQAKLPQKDFALVIAITNSFFSKREINEKRNITFKFKYNGAALYIENFRFPESYLDDDFKAALEKIGYTPETLAKKPKQAQNNQDKVYFVKSKEFGENYLTVSNGELSKILNPILFQQITAAKDSALELEAEGLLKNTSLDLRKLYLEKLANFLAQAGIENPEAVIKAIENSSYNDELADLPKLQKSSIEIFKKSLSRFFDRVVEDCKKIISDTELYKVRDFEIRGHNLSTKPIASSISKVVSSALSALSSIRAR